MPQEGQVVSDAFSIVHRAMVDDPQLAARVREAESPAERAEVLREAGLPVLTTEDIAAGLAALAEVAGGFDPDVGDDFDFPGGEASTVIIT